MVTMVRSQIVRVKLILTGTDIAYELLPVLPFFIISPLFLLQRPVIFDMTFARRTLSK